MAGPSRENDASSESTARPSQLSSPAAISARRAGAAVVPVIVPSSRARPRIAGKSSTGPAMTAAARAAAARSGREASNRAWRVPSQAMRPERDSSLPSARRSARLTSSPSRVAVNARSPSRGSGRLGSGAEGAVISERSEERNDACPEARSESRRASRQLAVAFPLEIESRSGTPGMKDGSSERSSESQERSRLESPSDAGRRRPRASRRAPADARVSSLSVRERRSLSAERLRVASG